MKLNSHSKNERAFAVPTKYYIAADGGGSKLQAILYDENLRVIRAGRTAGTNSRYKPIEIIRENINKMMSELLRGDGTSEPITEIAAADFCIVGGEKPKAILEEALRKNAEINEIHYHFEADNGTAAALKTNAAIALSGTGSDGFLVKNGKIVFSIGGWGPLLGDEGSGYDIGLNTLKAAIYSHYGRRRRTFLYDLVMEKWGLTNLREIIYRLADNPDARHEVASAALLCSEAARAGDDVAIKIYEHAAVEMFRLMRSVIEQNRESWDGSVIIMGGAWKGYDGMFEHFKQMLLTKYPEAKIEKPLFEPVVGCTVMRCWRDGLSTEEIRERLIEGFKDFLYK